MENKIKVTEKTIVNEIEFLNGLKLAVGDSFDEGRIIGFDLSEGKIEVILEWGIEGWSLFLDEDGEIIEED